MSMFGLSWGSSDEQSPLSAHLGKSQTPFFEETRKESAAPTNVDPTETIESFDDSVEVTAEELAAVTQEDEEEETAFLDSVPEEEESTVAASTVTGSMPMEPVIIKPIAEESVVEESVVEDLVAEEPDAEDLVAEESVVEEYIAEEIDTKELETEEPETEEPDTEESGTEEPDTEEPVAEEPVAEEPVAEEPDWEEPDIGESDTEDPFPEEPAPIESPVSQHSKMFESFSEEPDLATNESIEVDLDTSNEGTDKGLEEKATDETSPEYSEQEEDLPEEEIDLDFVEQYDNAFNEFIVQKTKFLMANPDLVHHLRVTKLQSLLTRTDEMENQLLQQLEDTASSKAETVLDYQQKLRDASRQKAALDIHLKSKLIALNRETRNMEGTLTWELICNSEACAKNQFRLTEEFKNKPLAEDQDLMSLLPGGTSFQPIRDAVAVPPNASENRPADEEDRVRQCQIDNAFLNGEIAMLKKKLEYQKAAARKLAWVESVLVRMDATSMKKLKTRYGKKVGVRLS